MHCVDMNYQLRAPTALLPKSERPVKISSGPREPQCRSGRIGKEKYLDEFQNYSKS